jgi:hypothetical protein
MNAPLPLLEISKAIRADTLVPRAHTSPTPEHRNPGVILVSFCRRAANAIQVLILNSLLMLRWKQNKQIAYIFFSYVVLEVLPVSGRLYKGSPSWAEGWIVDFIRTQTIPKLKVGVQG